LIPGHCYLVWTRDNHYAKFRVTGLSPTVVSFDWAYQTDPGNPELHARRAARGIGHTEAHHLDPEVVQHPPARAGGLTPQGRR
jgi:hypothetical protein